MYAKQNPGQLSQYSDELDGPGSIPGRVRVLSSLQRPDRLWEPTQPPIYWVRGAISPWLKRQGREADHTLSFNTEMKNGGALPSIPHVFMQLYIRAGKN
jgi:hypothetical protein